MPYFRQKRVGFTLLELLVALVVFTIVAVMGYSGLKTILTTQAHLTKQSEQLKHLQYTFSRLAQDIEQVVNRPIRDEYGDSQLAFQGDTSIFLLTRGGWRNPAQQSRSTLQRVSYLVQDKQLFRHYWWVLDRAQDSQPIVTSLLDQVEAFQLRYLDTEQKWHDQWPPATTTSLLAAIEVAITITDWGTLTRLFIVP